MTGSKGDGWKSLAKRINFRSSATTVGRYLDNLLKHEILVANMRIEFINPFITGLVTTFNTMLGCELRHGEISLKTSHKPAYAISGIIGLSGRAIGTAIISFSEPLALKAASVLLMVPCDEVDDDVTDAIGEIANIVVGSAKSKLEPYQMSISLPSVMLGQHAILKFPSSVQPITVPFSCAWGHLSLEVGLEVVQPLEV